jgi:hypothetical protein
MTHGAVLKERTAPSDAASIINDIIAFGAKADLDALEADITTSFEAKAEPVFNEYVGNKIDINRGEDGIVTIKFTQPVLIQKLEENHGIIIYAGAIFCGTMALLSASTVVPMMEQLHKGGRTKRVWSQDFVNWSKGGRVRPRSSYDARHQTLQCTSQIEHSALLSQVMRGFKYCKEPISTMKLELHSPPQI